MEPDVLNSVMFDRLMTEVVAVCAISGFLLGLIAVFHVK